MGEQVTAEAQPGATTGAKAAGTAAVHPDDAALVKEQAAKEAWLQDLYKQVGPLDHLKPQGPDMADPDGHCRKCGATIPKGSHECSACATSTEEFIKEINDF